MNQAAHKISAGFILYNDSAQYLPFFLPSLIAQDLPGLDLNAYDNSDPGHGESGDHARANFPQVKVIGQGRNIGFARAYNEMIAGAAKAGAEYFLAINPDMILEPDLVRKLSAALDADKELGSVSPKVMSWDFEKREKTGVIDTCGIREKSALRFYDLGQGEADTGQYDRTEILGPSGAAALYRMSALEKVKDEFGYFDSRMFMYFEDCDLAYRLRRLGFKSRLVPDAIIYHDRSARSQGQGNWQVVQNRKNKSRPVKMWAFRNKHLIFLKHWSVLSLRQKAEVLWYAASMLLFVVLFEQYLLKEYRSAWRLFRNTNNSL